MRPDEKSLNLEPLPSEHWGNRLRLARESRGLSLGRVEELSGRQVTSSSLSSLESLTAAPARKSQRQRAAMAMVLYGYAPSEVDLSLEDLAFIDITRLRDTLVLSPHVLGQDNAPGGDASPR